MRRMSNKIWALGIVLTVLVTASGYLLLRYHPSTRRSVQLFAWLRDPVPSRDFVIQAGSRCSEAPFIFPTTGVVGFLWDDSFQLGHRHQGIDIFAGTGVDVTPVVAAYPGFLTRLPDWKSSVIVRVPNCVVTFPIDVYLSAESW